MPKEIIHIDLNEYKQLKPAKKPEDIICLAVMIVTGLQPRDASVYDSNLEAYRRFNFDCDKCPAHEKCLAFILNE